MAQFLADCIGNGDSGNLRPITMGTAVVYTQSNVNPTQKYRGQESGKGDANAVYAKYDRRYDDPTYYTA